MDRDIERLHEVIGLLTESPGFYDRLSAMRNLEFFAGFYSNIDARAQVDKYADVMGLWERRNDRVGNFSKGMKQRLALARALLHEPRVLFLDEPTAGLDPEAAREVRDLISELRREGRTVFLSTHNLSEAELLCERIAVFKTRLLALDTPANLRERLFRRQVVVQLEAMDSSVVEAVRSLDFVRKLEVQDRELIVEILDLDRNRPYLVEHIVMAGGKVQGVSELEHSLEEVYLALVREDEEEEGGLR